MRCTWHSELRVRHGIEVQHLGLQRGGGLLQGGKKSRWSVISSLPCLIQRSKKMVSGDNSYYGQGLYFQFL